MDNNKTICPRSSIWGHNELGHVTKISHDDCLLSEPITEVNRMIHRAREFRNHCGYHSENVFCGLFLQVHQKSSLCCKGKTLSQTSNLVSSTLSFQTTLLNVMKMEENSPKTEKTVGKGENARYKQFLLFPQHFQKICTADT